MLGKKFGMLTITSEIYTIRTSKTYKVVDAVCDCGKKVIARHVREILKYKNPSCGCISTKKRPYRTCPICGKKFNKPGDTRCCSRTCMGKWYKQNGTWNTNHRKVSNCWLCGKDIPNGNVSCLEHVLQPLRRATSCPTCGCLVYLNCKHKSHYCSLKCKMKDPKRIVKGHKRPDIPSWRKGVLEAANGCCQVCGDDKNPLIAHHRKNMRDCATKEEAKDVSNGIAMCRPCHEFFHSFYGIFKNTPEEVDEFIERFNQYGKHVAPAVKPKKRKPKDAPAWTQWFDGKTRWTNKAPQWGKEIVFDGSVLRYCPQCDEWMSPAFFTNDGKGSYCFICAERYRKQYDQKRAIATP